MRILKIEMKATLQSNDPQISLGSDVLREQLFREMNGLRYELGERIRQRAAAYFPPEYSVFVRIAFARQESTATIHMWIEDPTIGWPAGLLARRAWKLSVPILAHVVKDTFQAGVQNVEMQITDGDASITAFAPTRGWLDPIVLTTLVVVASSIYWSYLHGPFKFWLGGFLGW
ncbi:MAG: hypothetical protein ACREC6_10570 [Hyphomicrobiaceae bacterium]